MVTIKQAMENIKAVTEGIRGKMGSIADFEKNIRMANYTPERRMMISKTVQLLYQMIVNKNMRVSDALGISLSEVMPEDIEWLYNAIGQDWNGQQQTKKEDAQVYPPIDTR